MPAGRMHVVHWRRLRLRELALAVVVGAAACSSESLSGQEGACDPGSGVRCFSDVTRPNHVANPEFDQGLTGWSTDPDRIALDTSGALSGANSARLIVRQLDYMTFTQEVSVVPNAAYVDRVEVYTAN